jgi:ParB family chromosome partitioning protein
MAKKGLGRGLNAIFQDHNVQEKDTSVTPTEAIIEVEISKIEANPYQPRKEFDQEALQELADSIKLHGLLEPILVRKHNSKFQIVAGERRFRAHQLNDSKTVKARVYDKLADKKMMEWALIENTQREQLSPIEEAKAYDQLIQEYGYTHEKLADSMGKSRSTISNLLRLTKLPDEIQSWLHEGKLTMGHARALLSSTIKDPVAEAQKIIEMGGSVRDVEKLQKQPAAPKKEKTKDPNITHFEGELRYKLGTDISIQQKANKKGSIQIQFLDDNDLTRILTTLLES